MKKIQIRSLLSRSVYIKYDRPFELTLPNHPLNHIWGFLRCELEFQLYNYIVKNTSNQIERQAFKGVGK